MGDDQTPKPPMALLKAIDPTSFFKGTHDYDWTPHTEAEGHTSAPTPKATPAPPPEPEAAKLTHNGTAIQFGFSMNGKTYRCVATLTSNVSLKLEKWHPIKEKWVHSSSTVKVGLMGYFLGHMAMVQLANSQAEAQPKDGKVKLMGKAPGAGDLDLVELCEADPDEDDLDETDLDEADPDDENED